MKKLSWLLICAMVLLSGCGTAKERDFEAEGVSAETTENVTAPSVPNHQGIEGIADWLEKDFSFSMSYEYRNLAYNGFSQETFQEFAEDGSFHNITTRSQWNYTTDYTYTEGREYYYQYEDGTLVCYMKANGEEPERIVMTSGQVAELAASKNMLVGAEGLMLPYAEDFHETDIDGENGLCTYAFQLPLECVMERETLLSVYVHNAFSFYGSEWDPAMQVTIRCDVTVERETLCPVKISYDFTELKPYVLSQGALSGEYALNENFMTLVYEFDYALADTIEIPKEFLP